MPAEAVRILGRAHMAPSVAIASAIAFVLSPGAPALAQRVDLCSARALTAPLREGLIPPVVGCDYAAIERVLGRGRYPIERRDAPSSRPKGVIFAQEPRVGSRVRPGTLLVLFVSDGSQTAGPGAPVSLARPERPGRPDRPGRPERPARPERPGIVDRPPPEAPVPRTAADLSVSVNPQSPAPSRAGEQTRTWIVVRNEGPSPATRIRVAGRWTNLRITGVTGACSRLPCAIAALEPGSAARIFVTAQVAGEGPYEEAVQVRAAERDPRPDNNDDRYARTVMAAPAGPAPEPAPAEPQPARPLDPPRAADTPPPSVPRPTAPPRTPPPPVASVTPARPEPAAPTRPAAPAETPAPSAPPAAPVPLEEVVAPAPSPAVAPRPATPEVSTPPELEPSAGGWLDPKRPRFWLLVVLAALGVGVPAVAVSMAKASAGQAAKWARLITVAPTLDRAGEASASPIGMAGPAISVRTQLEMGEAAPAGPVAVRTELEDV